MQPQNKKEKEKEKKIHEILTHKKIDRFIFKAHIVRLFVTFCCFDQVSLQSTSALYTYGTV